MSDPSANDASDRPARLAAYRARIQACRICRDAPLGPPLPHEPRPVLRVSTTARLLIAGQAPGARVHASGLPFDDASGDRLRAWMGVDREQFYDVARIAIAPMGFCFPGNDSSGGDLPPRKECAATWHDGLFALTPQIKTILLVGRYAQDYHFARLGRALAKGVKLEDAVRHSVEPSSLSPRLIALPHPSWRNTGWLKRHPWFEDEILPAVRSAVEQALRPI